MGVGDQVSSTHTYRNTLGNNAESIQDVPIKKLQLSAITKFLRKYYILVVVSRNVLPSSSNVYPLLYKMHCFA